MSETKENSDKSGAGGIRKPAAAPRRADTSGRVQQNLSKGQVHTVVVERKPVRKFTPPGGVKTEAVPGKPAGATGAASRPTGVPGRPAGRAQGQGPGKGLSTGEMDKRAQAVLVERKRAEEEAQRRAIEDAKRHAEEAARVRVEAEARQKAEAEAKAAGVELPPLPPTPPPAPVTAAPASPVTAPPASTTAAPAPRPRDDQGRPSTTSRPGFSRPGGPSARPGSAPAARAGAPVVPAEPAPPKGGLVTALRRPRPDDKTMAEEEESNKRKGGPGVKAPRSPVKTDERRTSGRLTVDKLLNDEQRERSLASLRRKREREARQRSGVQQSREKIVREVIVPEVITIQELANRMTEKAVDVIRLLMKQGAMHKINDAIDADTAELIVTEFGN